MIHSHSLARIALSATLLLAASATTRYCEAWDPFGIQDTHEYMPFGQYGPKLTIGTPSPTKIRNGGNFNKKNRTASQSNRVAHRTAPARVTPARTTRFNDLNLSVTLPTGPWVKLDPEQNGSKACFLATRTNPAIMISLAGEAVGVENTADTASLLAAAQTKMLTLPGATIEPGEHHRKAGGIPGIAFTATVTDGQSTAYYTIWVAAHHGYTYKLALYGDHLDQRSIDEATQNVLTGIKQIQSNRIARVESNNSSSTR